MTNDRSVRLKIEGPWEDAAKRMLATPPKATPPRSTKKRAKKKATTRKPKG